MNKKKAIKPPTPITKVRQRFERWRKSHQPRTRFPEELWSEAVSLAREYGHNRTARALGLDYYSLKKRLETASVSNRVSYPDSPSFVELFPASHSEYTIEIEDGEGGKMRISFKGGQVPDVVSLSRSFWQGKA
jgi:hypothetical protein